MNIYVVYMHDHEGEEDGPSCAFRDPAKAESYIRRAARKWKRDNAEWLPDDAKLRVVEGDWYSEVNWKDGREVAYWDITKVRLY